MDANETKEMIAAFRAFHIERAASHGYGFVRYGELVGNEYIFQAVSAYGQHEAKCPADAEHQQFAEALSEQGVIMERSAWMFAFDELRKSMGDKLLI